MLETKDLIIKEGEQKDWKDMYYNLWRHSESAKYMLEEKLYALTESFGGSCTTSGDYPGWAYRKKSSLRDRMVEVFNALYGREPKGEAIHAGVECGLLAYKIPGLDCVSLGPDMKNIHTTEEELSISSTERVWNYLLKVLEIL